MSLPRATQLVRRVVQTAVHRLLPLPHGQTAHRVTFEPDLRQRLGAFGAQVLLQSALLDAKERVARTVAKRLTRALRPPHRQPHALGDAVAVGGQRRAFVKTHDDVRTKQPLDLHRAFGRQAVFGAGLYF